MAKEKAIIISTHILEEVEAVCTRAVIIDRGRIVADGTAETCMRRVPYHGAVAMPRRNRPCRCGQSGRWNSSKRHFQVETVSADNG